MNSLFTELWYRQKRPKSLFVNKDRVIFISRNKLIHNLQNPSTVIVNKLLRLPGEFFGIFISNRTVGRPRDANPSVYWE
jgi:hypothetical protein